MSLRRLISLSALLAAVATALPAQPATAAVTWTQVSNTVDVSCAAFTYHQSSDWFLPATTSPKGLVYLQHGFSRSNGNMADLAEHYAAAGFVVVAPTLPSADIFGCTVSNLGNNSPFLNNVAALLGTANSGSGALARSYADALAKAGRPSTGLPTKYVIAGHSAGGEVAAYVANRLRSTYPSQYARVALVQLLDPVKSFIGSNMATGLKGIAPTGTPVYAISSPPYTANSDANGTVELTTDLHRPFLGVRLTTGCHCDAEGASTDGVCTLTSGTPQQKNIAALQTLAVAWATDALSGTVTGGYYPGGGYYDSLIATGVTQTLSGS
ncbi:alpha/beta hydrolase [Catellatospora tritici]|uniref:alpha/beta hydrolase n=1 Tax=Catellatospora tritici TaxID=2851566 RepID=UPI001C2D1794|nr:alpha/beta hydrolase [Catellatospora tritici]MBV1852658.1 alpha/beta hydrolase [Catellatospora tritici]